MLGTEKGNGDQFALHLLWSSPTLWGCFFHPEVCEVWERTKHAGTKVNVYKGSDFSQDILRDSLSGLATQTLCPM